MEDKEIISCLVMRNEDAIREIQNKFGSYCYQIANNILNSREAAEECVNDTLNIIWKTVPPAKPVSLKAYLGKIVRNQALIKYRTYHAQKRFCGLELIMDELDECIPSDSDSTDEANSNMLTEMINSWLGNLSKADRELFLRRYYLCESVREIAERYGLNQNAMAQRLSKLRNRLKDYLDKRGYSL